MSMCLITSLERTYTSGYTRQLIYWSVLTFYIIAQVEVTTLVTKMKCITLLSKVFQLPVAATLVPVHSV